MTKTLAVGQFVAGPSFRRAFPVETARSYLGEAGHERALKNGHDTAWTVNPGSVITSDRADNLRRVEAERAALAGAVRLCSGDRVEIDGELFTVRVVGEKFSDPIHFKRV